MRTAMPELWTPDFYRLVDPHAARVGLHDADPGWVSRHIDVVQDDFDIWYIAGGGGALQVDGRWHQFASGDLICIKPGSMYQRERADEQEGFRIYFAHILPFGSDADGLNSSLAEAWPLRMSLMHRPAFVDVFNRLFEASATRSDDFSLTVKGLACQLLDAIFTELQRTTPVTDRASRHVLRATEFIETHYSRRLTLADIATHTDLSPSHLSALFAEHMGCPPIEYLLRVRLREARLLLARGKMIKETAHAVGFGSQHYFSRAFKQRVGICPTQFAALHARDQ